MKLSDLQSKSILEQMDEAMKTFPGPPPPTFTEEAAAATASDFVWTTSSAFYKGSDGVTIPLSEEIPEPLSKYSRRSEREDFNTGDIIINTSGKKYEFKSYGNKGKSIIIIYCFDTNKDMVVSNIGFAVIKRAVPIPKVNYFDYDREVEEAKDFRKINYFTPNEDLYFSYNNVVTGVQNKDTFMVYKNLFSEDAFYEIKNTSDTIIVKVPYDWCILRGYNEKFVRKYLDVVNSFGLGRLTLTSLKEDDSFKKYPANKPSNGIKNNLFYSIEVKTEFDSFLPVLFNLVALLYGSPLPGIFMQTRETVKDFTDWQLLLMLDAFTLRSHVIHMTTEINRSGFLCINALSPYNTPESLATDPKFPQSVVYLFSYRFKDINTLFAKGNLKEAINQYLKLIH